MSVMPGIASRLYLQLRSTILTSPVETQPQQKQEVSPMVCCLVGWRWRLPVGGNLQLACVGYRAG
jgi:hypothetical protein